MAIQVLFRDLGIEVWALSVLVLENTQILPIYALWHPFSFAFFVTHIPQERQIIFETCSCFVKVETSIITSTDDVVMRTTLSINSKLEGTSHAQVSQPMFLTKSRAHNM